VNVRCRRCPTKGGAVTIMVTWYRSVAIGYWVRIMVIGDCIGIEVVLCFEVIVRAGFRQLEIQMNSNSRNPHFDGILRVGVGQFKHERIEFKFEKSKFSY